MSSARRQPLNVEDPRAEIPEGRGNSFLNPTGADGAKAVPKEKALGPLGELGLFSFFVVTRAIHPTIIHESKTKLPSGKMGFAYSNLSTVIVFQVVVLIVAQLFILATGGIKQWKSMWTNKKALMIFGMNGAVYALGDYLEMASMGSLGGAIYQVLQQSKFAITALLVWYIKGSKQTRLQWTLLVSLMLSMSLFMCLHKGSGGETPIKGLLFALCKVFTGSYGAVMTDKYAKEFKDLPTHVVLVQMSVPRLLTILLLSFMNPSDWARGIFHGWDIMTWGVTASFIVKSVVSLYIVSLLDSILKNIGETLSVLLIYFWEVLPIIMDPSKSFDMPPLLGVLVIILIVAAYIDTKPLVEKAKKFDMSQK